MPVTFGAVTHVIQSKAARPQPDPRDPGYGKPGYYLENELARIAFRKHELKLRTEHAGDADYCVVSLPYKQNERIVVDGNDCRELAFDVFKIAFGPDRSPSGQGALTATATLLSRPDIVQKYAAKAKAHPSLDLDA